jgi:predicted Fe-S protein YdhL (DUF1289 family)
MPAAAARFDTPSMVTPCTNVCTLHPVAGFCIGCGRTVDEIARWASMTDGERNTVMALLPARRAAMSAGSTNPRGG